MFGGEGTSKHTTREKKTHLIDQCLGKVVSLPAQIDLATALLLTLYGVYAIHWERALFLGVAALLMATGMALLGINAVLRELGRIKRLERNCSLPRLKTLDGREGAQLAIAYYSIMGYTVAVANTNRDKDSKVDLIARKGRNVLLVRCREWGNGLVELSAVQEIRKAMTERKAQGGVLITTGKFSPEAWEFGRGKGVEMLTGEILEKLISEAVGSTESDTQTSQGELPAPYPPSPAAIPRLIFLDLRAIEKGLNGLDEWLANHPSCNVIATTHREKPLEELRLLLPGCEYRLTGVTPAMASLHDKARYYEIMRYLQDTPDGRHAIWAAIDTDARQFPEGVQELIPVNAERGFVHETAERLTEVFRIAERACPIIHS